MFILYFLGVGPPCRSIFCQFWLCEEAQCVYLRRHLGSPTEHFYKQCFEPLNSLSGIYLVSLFYSVVFLGLYPVLLLATYFSLLISRNDSHILSLCCFNALGETATTPSFRMALCSSFPFITIVY